MSKDDTAVNDKVAADTTTTDSAPAENVSTEVAESKNEVDKDVEAFNAEFDDDESETESDTDQKPEAKPEVEEKPAEETQEEEQPRGEDKPLAPKSENRFQKLANENRELKEQLQRLSLQETQLATEQELLNEVNPETGDYYTPQEVERIAFQKSREQQQQTIAQEREQLEIKQSQTNLITEATKALEDFPMFDAMPDENGKPTNPDYNPVLAARADALLQKSLIRSQTIPEIDPSTGQPTGRGQVIGSYVSPYELYQTIADSTKAATVEGQARAQRSAEQMMAQAEPTGGTSHATTSKDKDLEDFNAAWDS